MTLVPPLHLRCGVSEAERAERAEIVGEPETAPPRVLVCDDTATMRALMRSLLGPRCVLLLASTGEEALERGPAFHPDVILCDLLLPGLSGAEVCVRAREVPALADVPFVLVTSVADADARADALEAGADDYLYKPIRERELVARVASLVRLRRAMRSSADRLAALERAHAELASTQAALVRAEKLASVGALAAGLAHEINNPLACIKSGAQAMLGCLDDVDEAAFEALAQMPGEGVVKDRLLRALAESNAVAADLADATRRIERITQDLRVFASPALAPEELVDPGEVVDAAWTVARSRALPRPALVREVEPGDPLLATRALVVQPIAVVLEHAALSAGPKGALSVRVRQIEGGVEVAVRSSGAGIPREELPRLFDPLLARRSGAGPGLAVAYGIVHGLGGNLSVESAPGEGATFRLRFPRRPGAFARG